MRVLAVVDGTVDADGPHTRGVSVTVTIVLLSAVPGRPDVDIAQSVSALMGTHEQTNDMNEQLRKRHNIFLSFSKIDLQIKCHYSRDITPRIIDRP